MKTKEESDFRQFNSHLIAVYGTPLFMWRLWKTGKLEIAEKFWRIQGTSVKDTESGDLADLVARATKIYNRYRSPEATAKLVRAEKDGFILEFEGPFCQSCGVNAYFEDFIYELEGICRSFRVEIEKIEAAGPQRFRVRYGIVGDVEEEALFREFLQDRGLAFKDFCSANNCTKDVLKFHFRTWLFEREQGAQKEAQP